MTGIFNHYEPMYKRPSKIRLYLFCACCGKLRNPFKGYYQLCNKCEKELEEEMKNDEEF